MYEITLRELIKSMKYGGHLEGLGNGSVIILPESDTQPVLTSPSAGYGNKTEVSS